MGRFVRWGGRWLALDGSTYVPPVNQPPSAVTILSATATQTSVTLSWTAAADPDGVVAGYRVTRDGVALPVVTGTSAVISDLTPGVTYAFTVAAVDDKGLAGIAATVSATTTAAVQGPPVNLRAVVDVTSLILAWDAPATGVPTSYRVYQDGTLRATVTTLTTAISGLTASTTYTFGVEAVGPSGVSSRATLTVTTAATPPKPSPTNVGVRPGVTLQTIDGDYVHTGGVLSNKNITGTLYLAGNDLTVDNVKAAGLAVNMAPGGNYFFPVKARHTVSYSEFGSIYTIGCDTLTLDHCRIGNTRTTFAQICDYQQSPQGLYVCRNLVITNCLFDRLTGTGAGTMHLEALHLMGCQGALIRNTVFDFTTADADTRAQITAALNVDNGNGTGQPCRDIVLEDVWFYGGGYFQAYLTMRGSSRVTNARFNSYPGMAGVQYPPAAGTTSFTQSGNTLDGAPITLATA